MTKINFNIAATELKKLLPHAQVAARDAGHIIMKFYNNPGSAAIEIKSDNTPVTDADCAASTHIETILQKLTPGISVISEENTDMPADTSLFWVVDPLDGTKEFIARTGGFAVKIALMDHQHPVLGIVYAPAFDTLYCAIRSSAAFKQTGTQAPVTLKARFSPTKGMLTTLFNKTHADPKQYDTQRTRLHGHGITIPQQPDITPGLPRNLQVAEGLADIHVNTGHNILNGGGYIWDNAADDIILTNAGGMMIQITDGQKLSYSDKTIRGKMPGYFAIGDKKLWKNIFPE